VKLFYVNLNSRKIAQRENEVKSLKDQDFMGNSVPWVCWTNWRKSKNSGQ